MTHERKTVGKSHFRHQHEADTQPRFMIANHATRNSKRVDLAKELGNMVASGKGLSRDGKTFGKPHFRLQDEANTQPRIVIANHAAQNSKKKRVDLARELGNMVAGGKDCQNIQGMSNNQMDESSKQQNIYVQGLTFRSAFNNNPHIELMVHDQNDLMDEESDQDWMFCLDQKSI